MAENTVEKEFAPGVYFRRQSFGKNKGEIIKMSFNWEEFQAWAAQHVNDQGFVNVDIKTSKNDNNKLYAELNTWVPASDGADDSAETTSGSEDEDEDLPY